MGTERGNRFLEMMDPSFREKKGMGRMGRDEARQAMEEVAAWLERQATGYDRASDRDAAQDKRDRAAAMRALVRGEGTAAVRDEAVGYIEALKKEEEMRGRARRVTPIKEHTAASKRQLARDRLIEYLESLPLA